MASIFSLYGNIFVENEDANKRIEETTKKGNKAGTSFMDLSKKAGDLSKKMTQAFTVGAAAITGLVEGTKDYRNAMAGLTTAFETNNLTSEQAKNTYKELYGILGDTDKAKEAAQFMGMLANNEKELAEWTNIATGVYSQFGDALPLEGLAEAANETAKVGQVTGVLADAINWSSLAGEKFGVTLKANTKENEEWNEAVKSATTSEEFFNLALQECTTEAERERLIRETLNGAYSEASALYQQTNADIINNNSVQAEMIDKTAQLAERLQPLITKGKELLVEVLEKILPYIEWIIDNINIIGPLVVTVWGYITALGMVSKIATFGKTLSGVFTLISANPIVLIIAAIIGAILLLIANWDKVKAAAKVVYEYLVKVFTDLKTKLTSILEGLRQIFSNVFNGLVSIVKYPINVLIGGLNNFISGLNRIKIPNWVPGVGGKGINLPLISKLRVGMDYVPYDEMPSLLHKGEMVLTKDEAQEYRQNRNVVVQSNNLTKSDITEAFKEAIKSFKGKVVLDEREVAKFVIDTVEGVVYG